MAASVRRRGVLQGTALASGLMALGVVQHRSAGAVVRPDQGEAITGSIAGHIRLSPRKGASIRLTELDRAAQRTRDLAVLEMPLAAFSAGGRPMSGGEPLRMVGERAQALAIRVAAAGWQVEADQCRCDGNCITHPATGRAVGYSAWVDFT